MGFIRSLLHPMNTTHTAGMIAKILLLLTSFVAPHMPAHSSPTGWSYAQSASLSDAGACDVGKYQSFHFTITDGLVLESDGHTDQLIGGKVNAKVLYKKYGVSAEFVSEKFGVKLPDEVKYIKNTKAFDGASYLDKYFRDAFYVGQLILFESGGCVYAFSKNTHDGKGYAKTELPITNKSLQAMKPIELNDAAFKDYACGGRARGFYLGEVNGDRVFILNNDCGDFEFKDMLLVRSGRVASKITIESDAWDMEEEEKNEIRDEVITTFAIDEKYAVRVVKIRLHGGKVSKKNERQFVIANGKFVEIR